MQNLDEKTGRWVEPSRGKKFRARRYIKRIGGGLKEVKRFFETIAEAKAFRNGTSVEKELAKTIRPTSRMTFGELVEHWKKDWLPNKDLSTQIRYTSYLKHFAFLMNMAVDEIEPTQIDKWIAHVKRPEYLNACHSTRCSYDHEFSVLRVILNFYSSRFNRNYRLPFIKDHQEMLKVKNKPTIKKDLTVDQLKAFIASLRKICWGTKWEAIYYLALMQYGVYSRVQEAAALSYEDFDLARNVVQVNKKVQWLRARGFENRIMPGAKTNGGKVLTPIPELALQIFKEWVMRSGIRSGLLFQLDGKIITYRQIEKRYTDALKAAGLPFRATHILRHAALTEAYESCKDLLTVQKLAGQRDLRSTTRYAKVRDQQVAETQRKMDEKLVSVWRK
ncbi:MAG: tyrosine-type recombinase/integrase [Deltaproteobacteria bacterium]|nr:tyrosine-type recombinase/integrase [Deltaproteobacteria bacterium]